MPLKTKKPSILNTKCNSVENGFIKEKERRLLVWLFPLPKYLEKLIFLSTRRWQSWCLNTPHSQQRTAEHLSKDMVLGLGTSCESGRIPVPEAHQPQLISTHPWHPLTDVYRAPANPATVVRMNIVPTHLASCSFSCLPIGVGSTPHLRWNSQLQILMLAFTGAFSMKLINLLEL